MKFTFAVNVVPGLRFAVNGMSPGKTECFVIVIFRFAAIAEDPGFLQRKVESSAITVTHPVFRRQKKIPPPVGI